jgi:hypothetical protein
MESNTKQTRACEDFKPSSPGSHIEMNPRSNQTTYWGVLCRTCRELVAFDGCPYVSFGPGAAGMKPGAIRCGRGHNHIYFPRDFRFIDATVPVTDAAMTENRESYRAINPRPPTSYFRPAASDAEPHVNHHTHVLPTVLASGNARTASPGTYQLSAKPYITAEGEFKGKLEGVMFIATSSIRTQQWFAINCGQLEKDFGALVSHEVATEIVAALDRGDNVDFPSPLRQEQFDRGFHYKGSPVHFILCALTDRSKN